MSHARVGSNTPSVFAQRLSYTQKLLENQDNDPSTKSNSANLTPLNKSMGSPDDSMIEGQPASKFEFAVHHQFFITFRT